MEVVVTCEVRGEGTKFIKSSGNYTLKTKLYPNPTAVSFYQVSDSFEFTQINKTQLLNNIFS
jgi:hypothetical protein